MAGRSILICTVLGTTVAAGPPAQSASVSDRASLAQIPVDVYQHPHQLRIGVDLVEHGSGPESSTSTKAGLLLTVSVGCAPVTSTGTGQAQIAELRHDGDAHLDAALADAALVECANAGGGASGTRRTMSPAAPVTSTGTVSTKPPICSSVAGGPSSVTVLGSTLMLLIQ